MCRSQQGICSIKLPISQYEWCASEIRRYRTLSLPGLPPASMSEYNGRQKAMRQLCLMVTLACCVARAQTASIESALSKKVLAPNQPLIEVQVYSAARVKSMPSVSSAAQWDQISAALRREILDKVVLRGQAKLWRDARTRVEWQES